MIYADSHCHLDFPDFAGELPELLAAAREAGVGYMNVIGTRLTGTAAILAICEAHDNLFATAGIHPHHAGDAADVSVAAILKACDHPGIVAVGETGLDFHYDFSDRAVQEQVFRNHVRAARELNLPLVIHSREAEARTRAVLEEEGAAVCGGVLHCFTGSPDLARWGVEQGFYISFSGILTFRTADALRAVAKSLPLERILIETDAPYLAPTPYRGKRNQPSYLPRVAEVLAELHGVPLAEVARITTGNYLTLFRIGADGRADG